MLRAVRFSATFGFRLEDETRAAIAPHGRPDPRRQRRADRRGDAAACWSSPAAATRCGCCWRRAWPPRCCRRSCRRTTPAGSGWSSRWPILGAFGAARLSLGLGGLAGRIGRCTGRPAGLPPLAAVEQRDGARRLAAGASRGPWPARGRSAGRRSSRCWFPRGSRTSRRCTRRPDRPGARRRPIAARCWQPREVLDPPPLVTGDDLLAHGVPAGPKFRFLLQRIRDAQLDGEIHTQAEAMAMVDRLLGSV